MLSNRDACNWCGRVIELLEGKHYCDDCYRCCVRECITCHKPYPSLKYFAHSDSERCNCCTTRNANQRRKKGKYTKNESIAMSMKNRKRRDDDGREDIKMSERSTTPTPSSKKKRRANPPVDDISDTASSSYSVSDNESVEEVDLLGEDVNNKTGSDYSDNEQEEERMMKKSRQKSNNRTVNEMLKAAEDKKMRRADAKNPDVPIQQKKKRVYNRRPNAEKTPAQAEKDLMKSLVNYKKALPLKAQINVVFVPE